MLRGFKLLYIEDDEGLIYLLKEALEAENCNIIHAKNGSDGLELIQNNAFDAVIVDHDMPQMSGLEVIKHVRVMQNPPPIVMVTGAGNEEVAVEAMRFGASDYIVKDTNMTYLKILPSVLKQVIQQSQLAREHEVAKQALIEEKIRSKLLAQFINDASHEFRTPLAVIRTSTDVLSYICKEPKQQQYLRKINNHVDDILQLVNDLIFIAKHDNSFELDGQKTVSLNRLLQDVVQSKSKDFTIKNRILDYELPQETITIQAYTEYLQRAFAELLSNACRFSNPGDTVTVRISKSQADVIIEFIDTGLGIAEENIPHIFERFYRVDTENVVEGFGLGLPIVARVISLHGGDIEVNSELGKGSNFKIFLPLE